MSYSEGPNGPLPNAILNMYPDAPLIERPGEINAWDNAEFRAAVEATGKKQIVMAGIVTDVCKLLHFTCSVWITHRRCNRGDLTRRTT